jgi:KUP system potassium uptake protein
LVRGVAAENPGSDQNPFFLLAPDWALIPMLIICDAGDGCVSGGYLGRVLSDAPGSASGLSLANAHYPYLGDGIRADLHSFINWLLYFAVVIVIVSLNTPVTWRPYGIAVTGTMVLTSILS